MKLRTQPRKGGGIDLLVANSLTTRHDREVTVSKSKKSKRRTICVHQEKGGAGEVVAEMMTRE
jgi:hypothetical protein